MLAPDQKLHHMRSMNNLYQLRYTLYITASYIKLTKKIVSCRCVAKVLRKTGAACL